MRSTEWGGGEGGGEGGDNPESTREICHENLFFFNIIILLKVFTISHRANTNSARRVCWAGKMLLLRRKVP